MDQVIIRIARLSMRPLQGQDRRNINEILISILVHYVAESKWRLILKKVPVGTSNLVSILARDPKYYQSKLIIFIHNLYANNELTQTSEVW